MGHVIYRKKVYKVLANNYMGFSHLYKLASRTQDGSPFGAAKQDCIPVYWSDTLGAFVTVPE